MVHAAEHIEQISPEARIRTVRQLTRADLLGLFNGNLLAVRWPNFIPTVIADRIATAILADSALGAYGDNRGVGRLGPGVYEILLGDVYWQEYVESRETVRTLLTNAGLPCDRLRQAVATAWSGCRLPLHRGVAMRPVMARIMAGGGPGALPHDDFQKRNDDVFAWATDLQAQLGMNIYVRTPQQGGELKLWDMSLSREDYDRMRKDGSYGLDSGFLPPPIVTIAPLPGEAIWINSTKLHAINAAGDGMRITLSSFVGMETEDRPLLMWS